MPRSIWNGTIAFGLGADRTQTPDLEVLAEGIETAFGELRRAASHEARGFAIRRSR